MDSAETGRRHQQIAAFDERVDRGRVGELEGHQPAGATDRIATRSDPSLQGLSPEEMEQQLDSMLEKIQSQPAYQRAVAGQENFDKLMMRVNQWIMDGMKKGAASPIINLS